MLLFMLMEQRLQKILSVFGIASRRKSEELILEGRVRVNGQIAGIGMKADPETDYIKVDGKLVTNPSKKAVQKVYLMFNKPKNIVTTLSDPEERPTVKDYLSKIKQRVFPVGRLDYSSEGLLLLTNDGDFANAVTHPSMKIPKTYLVKIKGLIEDKDISKLRRGVRLEDGLTLPARVKRISRTENNSWLEITIYEGRRRQIRRMLEETGHPVSKLKRISIGELRLGDLKPGEIRPLTQEELRLIKNTAAGTGRRMRNENPEP